MPETTLLLIEGPIAIRRGAVLEPEFVVTIGGRPIASAIGLELLRDEAPGAKLEIAFGALTIQQITEDPEPCHATTLDVAGAEDTTGVHSDADPGL